MGIADRPIQGRALHAVASAADTPVVGRGVRAIAGRLLRLEALRTARIDGAVKPYRPPTPPPREEH